MRAEAPARGGTLRLAGRDGAGAVHRQHAGELLQRLLRRLVARFHGTDALLQRLLVGLAAGGDVRARLADDRGEGAGRRVIVCGFRVDRHALSMAEAARLGVTLP